MPQQDFILMLISRGLGHVVARELHALADDLSDVMALARRCSRSVTFCRLGDGLVTLQVA